MCALNLPVVYPCKGFQSQQRLARGHPIPPLHLTLAKAIISARHVELAVGPCVFQETNVHAKLILWGFFATVETRFPIPRKVIAHRMSFPPGPTAGRIVHCLFSSPLTDCEMGTRLLPLEAHVSYRSFMKGKGSGQS